MASHKPLACSVLAFFFAASLVSAQLTANFYDKSCPNALYTIQTAVKSAVAKENRMGASLLRLHFHDCFVNASLTKSADMLHTLHFLDYWHGNPNYTGLWWLSAAWWHPNLHRGEDCCSEQQLHTWIWCDWQHQSTDWGYLSAGGIMRWHPRCCSSWFRCYGKTKKKNI